MRNWSNEAIKMELGPLEILVILAVVVMIFGVGKLPEVGSSLGKGIREFRAATHEDEGTPKPEESKAEPSQPVSLSCPVCGAPNTATVRFCTSCGRPMSAIAASEPSAKPEGVDCPTCGALNAATVRFCSSCGRPMSAIATSEPSVKPEGVDCPTCGAPNTATVRFCTNCGRPMTPVADA
jgi:sec-independent protein translocase protein TatA